MRTTRLLLALVLCLSAPVASLAQWEPEVRLTDNSAESMTSFDNAWCVATAGPTVHVVWHDARNGTTDIYYKRSLDGGDTWDPDTRLTVDPSWSERPSVAVRDAVVHVAWYDGRIGPPRIFYKRSLDNGTTWEPDICLTPTVGVGYHPSLAVYDSIVHVAWTDMSAGPQIYYTRSVDDGATWEPARNITPGAPPAGKNLASIAVADALVHVTWTDSRSGPQIYYTRSLDYGVTWEADRCITPVPSQFASVAVSAAMVHVVYADFRSGNELPRIYYTRSLDSGVHWETEVPLAEAFCSWYPTVAVAGSEVHAAWLDNRNGDVAEIYYRGSFDAGLTWEPEVRLTENPGESREPSLAVWGTHVHVVWHDDRDANWEIYYKRGASDEAGVEEQAEASISRLRAHAAPSIFRDRITVRLDEALKGPLHLAVYDVRGVPVCAAAYGAAPGLLSLEDARIERLAPGVYFLRMDADRQVGTQKLIKIRQ